jgi:flavin-dependent dehydrogenase
VSVAAPVLVIGGGPGGSICAARLAKRGVPVVVLEKTRHPRFHLGESLLPHSVPVLDEAGVLDDVHARFLVKRGACFHDDIETSRVVRYAFEEAYRPARGYAYQVPRDDFDELLLRHAARCGADVREGWTAARALFDRERAVGVVAKSEAGETRELDASFVVDASGRDAVVARARSAVTKIAELDKTALYTQFRGALRDGGDREGDIQIVVFRGGWFWVIPFKDGRTSAGAVVSSAWVRANKDEPQAMFLRAVSESKTMQRILADATQLFPAGATADFSFRVGDIRGDGWIAVGDSSGFIDPLFSTGAHLAMNGALAGADAIARALDENDVSRARFEAWERAARLGAETFVGVVQAFYSGALTPYLFAETQHPYLRRAITSMLAGDVFDDDARWIRDLRQRFPARS